MLAYSNILAAIYGETQTHSLIQVRFVSFKGCRNYLEIPDKFQEIMAIYLLLEIRVHVANQGTTAPLHLIGYLHASPFISFFF